jgi:hypothetical protein
MKMRHRHTWELLICGPGFLGYGCKCGASATTHDDGAFYYSPRLGVWVRRDKAAPSPTT